AIEALARADDDLGATSETLTLYGRALAKAGQNEAAEQVLQKATLVYPVDPVAFETYALAAERAGHFAAARTALAQYGALVGADSTTPARYLKIGQWSIGLNDPPAAATALRRAEAASPTDTRALGEIADAQLRAGDAEGARLTLQRGLAKDPN